MEGKTDNELIAEFMGIRFDASGQCPEIKYSWRPGVYDPLRVEHLQYNNNWSWLMPVVEKIESLGYEVDVYKHACEINVEDMIRWEAESKIEACYKSVVEFIKWYNRQKEK